MSTDLATRCRAALDRFNAGEIDAAVREMRELGAAGHAPAQVFVGWACEVGHVAPADLTEAKRWYSAAADAGDPIGHYYLGLLLMREGDVAGGADSIRRSADHAYAPALYQLGKMYGAGLGLPKDEAEAVACMSTAAATGHPFAQRWIARRGIRGRDGLRGFLRAVRWFASVPAIAIRLGWKDPSDQNILVP